MRPLKSLVVVLLLVLSRSVWAEGVMVASPWIREAPPNAPALGGFMVIHNQGDSVRRLVAAESPTFAEVQLHRTVMADGMAKMIHQPTIEIPAHGSQTFAPGGYHLMLMHPKMPLKAGDRVDITLRFEDGEVQQIVFPVQVGAAMAHNPPMEHGMADPMEGHEHH